MPTPRAYLHQYQKQMRRALERVYDLYAVALKCNRDEFEALTLACTGVQARVNVQKSHDFTPTRWDSGFGGARSGAPRKATVAARGDRKHVLRGAAHAMGYKKGFAAHTPTWGERVCSLAMVLLSRVSPVGRPERHRAGWGRWAIRRGQTPCRRFHRPRPWAWRSESRTAWCLPDGWG